MRDSPWFQPKRSESAPPAQRARETSSISLKEQDDVTARISRPTESALYRRSLFWKLDSFMNKGFHSWSKMELFDDCKRCMWNKDGAIKFSCKIRPLDKGLPPLRNSGEGIRSCQGARSSMRSDKGKGNSSRAHDRAVTSRSIPHIDAGPMMHRGASTSREGVHFRRGTGNASLSSNFGSKNFGAMGLRNTTGNGLDMTGVAVPRIAHTRPIAAVGQRV